MRCLLDKVTTRYTVQGFLKLAEKRSLTPEEISALDLFSLAAPPTIRLFIVPPTASVLQKLAHLPQYSIIIQLALNRVEVVTPTRYFKRWARRLRDYGFAREDAAILALATFGTDKEGAILGMDYVATFDQPMINHWLVQQQAIQDHLTAMKSNLSAPYHKANLPQVLRPEQIDV